MKNFIPFLILLILALLLVAITVCVITADIEILRSDYPWWMKLRLLTRRG